MSNTETLPIHVLQHPGALLQRCQLGPAKFCCSRQRWCLGLVWKIIFNFHDFEIFCEFLRIHFDTCQDGFLRSPVEFSTSDRMAGAASEGIRRRPEVPAQGYRLQRRQWSVPQKTGSLGWCLLLFFWAGDNGCQNFQMLEVGVWNSMETYGVQLLTRNHGFDHQVLNPSIGDYCGKTCHIFSSTSFISIFSYGVLRWCPSFAGLRPPRTIARYTYRY